MSFTGVANGFMGLQGSGARFGPNLIVNGNFATATDWSLVFGANISDGVLKCASTGGFARGQQEITAQIGETYEFKYDVSLLNNNGIVRIGTTSSGFDILNQNVTSVGTGFTHTFTSTAETLYVGLWLGSNTAGHRLDYDNVSVRRVL